MEAIFRTDALPELEAELEARGLAAPDHELVVRRVVSRSGRSRAQVAGQLVPVSLLAELFSGRLEISSQHESQALLRPESHASAAGRLRRVPARARGGAPGVRGVAPAGRRARAAAGRGVRARAAAGLPGLPAARDRRGEADGRRAGRARGRAVAAGSCGASAGRGRRGVPSALRGGSRRRPAGRHVAAGRGRSAHRRRRANRSWAGRHRRAPSRRRLRRSTTWRGSWKATAAGSRRIPARLGCARRSSRAAGAAVPKVWARGGGRPGLPRAGCPGAGVAGRGGEPGGDAGGGARRRRCGSEGTGGHTLQGPRSRSQEARARRSSGRCSRWSRAPAWRWRSSR